MTKEVEQRRKHGRKKNENNDNKNIRKENEVIKLEKSETIIQKPAPLISEDSSHSIMTNVAVASLLAETSNNSEILLSNRQKILEAE